MKRIFFVFFIYLIVLPISAWASDQCYVVMGVKEAHYIDSLTVVLVYNDETKEYNRFTNRSDGILGQSCEPNMENVITPIWGYGGSPHRAYWYETQECQFSGYPKDSRQPIYHVVDTSPISQTLLDDPRYYMSCNGQNPITADPPLENPAECSK
ncbi:MAG: hypothetical protein JXB25_11205 [Deltaproteobacteria bacterium]|nr:hypothetical protein [Deltaproteobacteria bacterium]